MQFIDLYMAMMVLLLAINISVLVLFGCFCYYKAISNIMELIKKVYHDWFC